MHTPSRPNRWFALLPVAVFLAFFGIAFLSLQEASSQVMPQVGDKVPDIELPNLDGKNIKLSEIKNQGYILIDFWASWCGPCRKENPHVVEAYEAYKEKGFAILNISLDKDQQKWKDAIKKDKLSWNTHMIDLKGNVAKQYGIKYIPTNFLIDKQGTVVAVNLRGEELKATLQRLLKS